MSHTEDFREMLDEHGVSWWEGADWRQTFFIAKGLKWEYFNSENGDAWLGFLSSCEQDISPERAIAAIIE